MKELEIDERMAQTIPMLTNIQRVRVVSYPQNTYAFQILFRKIPKMDELRFECRDGLWYAEKEGFAQYFWWRGPGNEDGNGGRHIWILDKDGREVVLKGPWSSRAGAVNKAGFGPCLEISWTEDPETYGRGYTFIRGAITLEMAQLVCAMLGDVELVRTEDFGDVMYDLKKRRPKLRSNREKDQPDSSDTEIRVATLDLTNLLEEKQNENNRC